MKKFILLVAIFIVFAQCSGDGGSKYKYSCPFSSAIDTENAHYSFDYNTTALDESDLIIMSRNLYIGADLLPLFAGGFQAIQNTGIVLDNAIDSEFPRRARGIAWEIKKIDPDIIALQEVITLKTGEQNFNPFTNEIEVDANCTELNFLDILMEALNENNLTYKVAVKSLNADIELTDFTKDIRLTDYDVILVKEDMNVTGNSTTVFDANLSIDESLPALAVTRSYSRIDLTFDKNGTAVDLYIFNTHMEVPENETNFTIQIAQGQQLVDEISLLQLGTIPIIIIGDINSGPNVSDNTTYKYFLDNNYTDSWLDNRTDSGYTCCYVLESDDINNTYERIDHVFYWNPSSGPSVTTVNSIITQLDINEQIIKTDSSTIWPSDHAARITGFKINP